MPVHVDLDALFEATVLTLVPSDDIDHTASFFFAYKVQVSTDWPQIDSIYVSWSRWKFLDDKFSAAEHFFNKYRQRHGIVNTYLFSKYDSIETIPFFNTCNKPTYETFKYSHSWQNIGETVIYSYADLYNIKIFCFTVGMKEKEESKEY